MKTILITGATSGVGEAGARALGSSGWRVFVHGRTREKAADAVKRLRARVPEGNFEAVAADLGSLTQVRSLAAEVATKAPVLDALWNNAGALSTRFLTSTDGVELQMAVNHLAGFVLTNLLLGPLKAAPQGRVVFTSSMAHAMTSGPQPGWFEPGSEKYRGFDVYGKTKLANIITAQDFAKRLASTRVTVHSFHPGFVNSGFGNAPNSNKLFAWAASWMGISPEKGADTGVWLVESRAGEETSGQYWVKRKVARTSTKTRDGAAERLWAESVAAARQVLGNDFPDGGLPKG